MSLRNKTIGALKWSFVQEIAQKFLQFAIGILMARLLSPREFGLVALLTVLVVVAQVLLESGFGSALIQRKDPTATDESSVFYFNVVLGLLLAGLLWLAAPAVAAFYELPELTALARAMAVILVINGFAVVQNALMVRRLDFRRQAVISITGTFVSGAVGLTMAWRGYGVWSLVAQQVANSLVRTLMSWLLNSWRPSWLFDLAALKDMFRFGSGMAASVLLNTVFGNLYPLVIGKLFPAAQLGYYNRAQTLEGITSTTLSSVVSRVAFPVFSKLQDDPVRLRNGLRRAMRTLAFLQFPAMLGLAAVAEPLVLFLLTDKWAPSIPFLQALCFVGLLHPIHMLNVNVLMAQGRTGLLLRLELIKKGLLVATLAVTAPFGILAIIWGQVAMSVIGLAINTHYTRRLADYSLWDQFCDFGPYLGIASVMGIIVWTSNLSFVPGHFGQLAGKVVLGATLYGIMAAGLRLGAMADLVGMMRRREVVAAA